MSHEDLLNGGVEALNEIKDYLLELQGYEENAKSLHEKERDLDKAIQKKRSDMEDEINQTIKKRKQDVNDSFEEQLNKIKVRAKKLKQQRSKEKDQKVSERIDEETIELRNEEKRIRLEIKAKLKQKKIPRFCGSRFFLALYFPSGILDILIILLTLAIVLFVIPYGSFKLFVPEKITGLISVIYIVCVVVFGSIYIFLNNNLKEPHKGTLKEIRGLNRELARAKKRTVDKEKQISKDPDESSYGLEAYDAEMDQIRNEESEVVEHMKNALLEFEQQTIKVITDEIKSKWKDELDRAVNECKQASEEATAADKKTKDLRIKLASDYEGILGKERVSLETVNALTDLIESGAAADVRTALNVYSQKKES